MGAVDLASVTRILAEVGVTVRGPRVVAAGRTLVLADGDRALRISPDGRRQEEEHLHLVALLAADGAPVLEPLSRHAVESVIGTVTVWPLARPSTHPEEHLGALLRRLHRTSATLPTGRHDPRRRLRRQLAGLPARSVPADVVVALEGLAAQLAPETGWRGDSTAVIHGDAHRGNVMEHGGRPVLIDNAGVQRGPWQLDLVPTWAAARRNGGDWSAWYRLKEAYDDPRLANGLWDWEHLAEAVLERELITTIFLAEQWLQHPWVRDEILMRIDTWNQPDSSVWNSGLPAGR